MRRTASAWILCLFIILLSCVTRRAHEPGALIAVIEIPWAGTPVVDIQVLVKSGSADDPVGKEGLAEFTANLMTRSAAGFDRREIEKRLEHLGARLDVKVDRETILFSCRTLRESLDGAYDILSDMILNPTFPESEAAELKLRQENDLNEIITDDSKLCLAVFQNVLYQDHRYAHPVAGFRAAIKSFTSEDAASYYRSNFRSGNVMIGIAGDYPVGFPERMRSHFETLPSGPARHIRGSVEPIRGRRAVLVERENGEQTHIRIGNIASYDRLSPDYYAILAAGACLGGHRESFTRLLRAIRNDRGLAYQVYSYPEHFEQHDSSMLPRPLVPWSPTYYSIRACPETVNAEFTIKLTLLEFTDLIRHGIEPADLERMKQFMANHFVFLHETPARRLSLEIEQLYYGDSAYIKEYADRVSQVSAMDVASAVRNHWSEDDWLLVAVVSDGEQFKAELLDDRTAVEYAVGSEDKDLQAIDEQVKRLDLRLTGDDITIVKASELFK